MMKKTYILEDLDCAHCAEKIEAKVADITGVESCSLNFLTCKLVVEAEEGKIPQIGKEIKKIVKKLEPDVTVQEK